MPPLRRSGTPRQLPLTAGIAAQFLISLLPPAERREVRAEVERECLARVERKGALRATLWIWLQLAASMPALLRRMWTRGITGFDSRANVMNPGGPRIERWILDARFAVRRLRRRPAYTALASITLAIGVGGLAAIAGIVRPLLIEPLPYPHAEQLAKFWRPGDWRGREVTALRGQWAGFSGVAAYRPSDVTLERDGEPTRLIAGIAATTELFGVLGVSPILGRGFQRGEDTPGAAPVAVLSNGLWRELGADPKLVGKTLRLDGVDRAVIGVMPPNFWFPDPSVGVWTSDSLAADGGVGFYTLVGRIAPDRTVGRMQPAIDHITRELGERFTYSPEWDLTKHAALTSLREAMVAEMRAPLFATLGGMLVILLIACANVAALTLGQTDARSTELAVRAALGADRGRIASHIIFEIAAIGMLAGVIGVALAMAGFDVLRNALPLGVWREHATLDATVFVTALGIAIAAALAVAMVPLVSLARRDLQRSLASSRASGHLRRGGLQSPIVVTEVALAVLLGCASGLLMRSVARLYAVNPGIETRGIAVLDVATPTGASTDDRRAMLERVRAALAQLPGVRSVAIAQRIPLRGPGWTMGLQLPDAPPDTPSPHFRMVSREYFLTLGIPLVHGRVFDSADRATDSVASIVVNEALVQLYFPRVNPIGQVMRGGFGKPERIVGVVRNVAEASLTDRSPPVRYYLADQVSFVPGAQTLVVRVAPNMDPLRVIFAARRSIAAAAPSMAVQQATTMSRVLDRAVGPARDIMSLLVMLTVVALVLGAVGIYGVVSQFVGRRNREWSIRVALGLAPRKVASLVLGHGLSLVGAGIVIGVIAALGVGRLLSSFMFGVTTHDPLAMGSAAVVLFAVGIVAALIPAVRAARADPAMTLREE